jgi:aromatic O-demethylase, cytochrome P450 subunit
MPADIAAFSLDLEQMAIDPYPTYREMRAVAPVAFVPELGVWMVTRWDDVEAVATDRDTWGSPAGLDRLDRTFGEPNILTADGDVHASLRLGIDKRLRPRAVGGYVDDLVRPTARRLAERLRDGGEAELVAEYLEPLSVLVLGELLSLGDLGADALRRLFKELQQGSGNTTGDPTRFAVSDGAVAEIMAHVDPILDRLEEEPDGSLLAHMLHAGGAPRPRSEIYPSFLIVMSGGMREPVHAGATTLLGLLTNPDQLEQVITDPKLITRAIVEGLRWIAPIAQAVRSPVTDAELAGVPLPAGAMVHAVVASANRDERRFQRPDEYDLARSPNAHLSFGHGRHFCAGNFFARQMLRIGLEELLHAVPALRLDPEAGEPRVHGLMFRAPVELRVRCR